MTVSVTPGGETKDGFTPMNVTFMKGDEVMRSVAVFIRASINHGSDTGQYMAAAMKAQEGAYNLSKEMHTALADAIGHWIDIRTLEVRQGK